MDRDTFVIILADVIVIQKMNLSEQDKLLLSQQLFQYYDTSPAQFLKTKEYYQSKTDFWFDIYSRAEDRIKDPNFRFSFQPDSLDSYSN